MSRSVAGVYTLAVGNPVVAGTTILAAWANNTLNDLATAMTDSLSRTGLGGMLAPLLGVDGATAAPQYSWTSEPTSGWYRKAAGASWFSILGVDIFGITATGITLAVGKFITYPSQPSITFTNRLINGSWRFDQNREGASVYTASGGTVVAMDAWSGSATGAGTFTMQRVADPDNASLFALKIACTVADAAIAAGDVYSILTAIEGYDVADLKAGTASASQITISFDMKFDVAGVYPIAIRNSAANRSYVGSVTQLVAGVNESKTLTLTLDTGGTWLYTNGVGLYMNIGLAVGSTFQTPTGVWTAGNFLGVNTAMANFMSLNTNVGYIKRIQLEKGPNATSFQEISEQQDLARVQRYACKSYSQGVQLATVTSAGRQVSGQFGAGTGPVITQIRYPVEMRATPTVTGYSWATGLSGLWGDGAGADQPVIFGTGNAGAEAQMALGTITASAGHYYANARLS